MKNYEFVKNQRNNINLVHENEIYNKSVVHEGQEHWRCNNRKCGGKGRINESGEFVLMSGHNHPKNNKKILRLKIANEIKEKTKNNANNNMDLITSITKNIEENNIKNIQQYKTLNDKIIRIKNKIYKNEENAFDDIPNFLKFDLQGERFLQFDNGVKSKQRFMLFYSSFTKNYCKKVKNVIIDGTFWSVPKGVPGRNVPTGLNLS